MNPCPTCGKDDLVEQSHGDWFPAQGGPVLVLELEHMVCTYCGQESVTPDQLQRNEAHVSAERQKILYNYYHAMTMTVGRPYP